MTLVVVGIMSIIVSMVTALVNFPIDSLFELLLAPSADPVKLKSSAESSVHSTVRRMSAAAMRVSTRAIDATGLRNVEGTLTRGFRTRHIPDATRAAHEIAASSASTIAPRAAKMFDRQKLERKRLTMMIVNKENSANGRKLAAMSSKDDDLADSTKANPVDATDVEFDSDDEYYEGLHGEKRKRDPIGRMIRDMKVQRMFLAEKDLVEFDKCWGLDLHGNFIRGKHQKERNEHLIRREAIFTDMEVKERIEKLKYATNQHAGLEILHLFVMDLLGRNTPVACIFEVICLSYWYSAEFHYFPR